MLLMIDNYDSFTYNIVQYLSELGADVAVHRNDEITIAQIERLAPDAIVISPGPCTPTEAGVSMDVVSAFGGRIPILGVCLGHQCIGAVFGGDVVRARQVMHGKTSMIHHSNSGVFEGLPTAVRGNSISLADRQTGDAAGVPGNHCVDAARRWRLRRDHGSAAPDTADRGCPVPSRVDLDAVRARSAAQLSASDIRHGLNLHAHARHHPAADCRPRRPTRRCRVHKRAHYSSRS